MTYDIYYLANFGGAIGNFVKRHEAELRFSFDIVEKAVQTMVLILCLSYYVTTVKYDNYINKIFLVILPDLNHV